MDPLKRRRIEEAGWTVGSVQEFLGLTPDEAAFVEMKVDPSRTATGATRGEIGAAFDPGDRDPA